MQPDQLNEKEIERNVKELKKKISQKYEAFDFWEMHP